MRLHLFNYECKNCGKKYKSPQLLGNAYGEFLLRDNQGGIVYLNSFKDYVFDEVATFFKSIVSSSQARDAKLFHEVLSVACDNNDEGDTYQIGQKPICPNCRKINIGKWGPTNPPEIIEMNIPAVTHQQWNQLNKIEKQSKIEEAVKRALE